MARSSSKRGQGALRPGARSNDAVAKRGGSKTELRGSHSSSAAQRTAIDWEAVRYAYLHSGMSQARIAETYNISETALRRHREAGGWKRVISVVRTSSSERAAEQVSAVPQTRSQPRGKTKIRGSIIERLYNLLDAKMSEIENRMAEIGAHPLSAAEAERDARNLNTLARLYAKLAEMDEAKAQSERKTKNAEKTKDAANADRLRRDLASRLARLQPGDD